MDSFFDRRSHLRFPFLKDFRLALLGVETREHLFGMGVDVSSTGLCIKTTTAIAAGSMWELSLGNDLVTLTVIWIVEIRGADPRTFRCGLRTSDLDYDLIPQVRREEWPISDGLYFDEDHTAWTN